MSSGSIIDIDLKKELIFLELKEFYLKNIDHIKKNYLDLNKIPQSNDFIFNSKSCFINIERFNLLQCTLKNNTLYSVFDQNKKDYSRCSYYDVANNKFFAYSNYESNLESFIIYINNELNRIYDIDRPIKENIEEILTKNCLCEQNNYLTKCMPINNLINVDDSIKLLIKNLTFLSQTIVADITSDKLGNIYKDRDIFADNILIGFSDPKLNILDKEKQTISLVCTLTAIISINGIAPSDKPDIIGKAIIIGNFNDLQKNTFCFMELDFDIINDTKLNAKQNFEKSLYMYLKNIYNITKNVNVLRCLNVNEYIPSRIFGIKELTNKNKTARSISTSKKINKTYFTDIDCSGYNIGKDLKKLNRKCTYYGLLNYHYTKLTDKQCENAKNANEILEQFKVFNILSNKSYTMIVFTDYKTILNIFNQYFIDRPLNFFDFIEISNINGIIKISIFRLNGEMTYEKTSMDYNTKTHDYFLKDLNIKPFQRIYFINCSDFVNIPQKKILDPHISEEGLHKLNIFLTYFNTICKISYIIIVSSALSRHILPAAAVINLQLINPKPPNIELLLKLKLFEWIFRQNNLGNNIELGNIDMFNEKYKECLKQFKYYKEYEDPNNIYFNAQLENQPIIDYNSKYIYKPEPVLKSSILQGTNGTRLIGNQKLMRNKLMSNFKKISKRSFELQPILEDIQEQLDKLHLILKSEKNDKIIQKIENQIISKQREKYIKQDELDKLNAKIRNINSKLNSIDGKRIVSSIGNSTISYGGFRKRSKKYNNKNNKHYNNKTKTHKIKYINKHKKTNHKSKGKTSKK